MIQPGAQDHPANERDAQRRDANEQIVVRSRAALKLAARDLVEGGAGENPAAMQPDRQPERAGADPRIGQNPAEQKQGREAGEDEQRLPNW